MRRRSSAHWRLSSPDVLFWSSPRRILVWAVLFLGIVSISQTLFGQSRKWSAGGSVGYAMLNLGAVDGKNQSDTEGWGRLGFPIGPFASIQRPIFYSASVSYRYNREFAVSLMGSYWWKIVYSSYNSLGAMLQLDRGVGSADIVAGIAYYPAAQPYFLQWYAQVNFGLAIARATAKAVGSRTIKVGGVPTSEPVVDTDGIFKKTRTTAGLALGTDVPLLHNIFLKAEAGYRFAQLGQLEGEATHFGEHSTETTTIEFDYSGILLSAGVQFEF